MSTHASGRVGFPTKKCPKRTSIPPILSKSYSFHSVHFYYREQNKQSDIYKNRIVPKDLAPQVSGYNVFENL